MPSFIERAIEREIDSINDHLPQKLIPLSEIMEQSKPGYTTKDGTFSAFKREEIDYLIEEVPIQFHQSITLPVVILRRMDLGRGVHTVAGTKPVLFLMHRIIGDVNLEWSDLARHAPSNRFARPQVQIIRRKLPTTTCIGFVTSISERR